MENFLKVLIGIMIGSVLIITRLPWLLCEYKFKRRAKATLKRSDSIFLMLTKKKKVKQDNKHKKERSVKRY